MWPCNPHLVLSFACAVDTELGLVWGAPKGRPEPEVVFGVHPRNPIDPRWSCADRRTEKLRELLTAVSHSVCALGPQGGVGRAWVSMIALQTNRSDLCSWGLRWLSKDCH